MNGDLKNILVNDLKLSPGSLTPDATLEAAGFDSLAIVELSVLLGDRFGIDVSETDIKGAVILERLDHIIQCQLHEKGASS